MDSVSGGIQQFYNGIVTVYSSYRQVILPQTLRETIKEITFSFFHESASTNVQHGSLSELYNLYTRVYPKVSGLAAWSENCKWYSSLPLGAVVSIFCESV
jgi:hypothetical protein